MPTSLKDATRIIELHSIIARGRAEIQTLRASKRVKIITVQPHGGSGYDQEVARGGYDARLPIARRILGDLISGHEALIAAAIRELNQLGAEIPAA